MAYQLFFFGSMNCELGAIQRCREVESTWSFWCAELNDLRII
jgi:hypothetical protein